MLDFEIAKIQFDKLSVGDTILLSQRESSGEKPEEFALIIRLHVMAKEEKYDNDQSKFFIKLGNDASL